jgi:predicted aspartyl protease
MGCFYTDCRIQNHRDPGKASDVRQVLVDTGSEHTWINEEVLEAIAVSVIKKDMPFVMANGQRITRSVGYAIIQAGGTETIDEVVFAEPGDLQLLGSRTLEGLNLRVDAQQKKLVAAGPILAAANK